METNPYSNNEHVVVIKEAIIKNINNPEALELLYRKHKQNFSFAFNEVYATIKENTVAQSWYARLNYKQEEISWGRANELYVVLVAIFFAGIVAKISEYTKLPQDIFISRNIGFIVFPFLMLYFTWRQRLSFKNLIFPAIAVSISAIYMNSLPNDTKSNTILLASIHAPIFIWTILGYTYLGASFKNRVLGIQFLRFNGELVVMSAVIFLSGMLFIAVSVGLFKLIGINMEAVITKYIAIWGAPAIPIVGTYLVLNNPQLVNKISPVIARIFTPLVFVTLSIFLISIVYTGKYPYNDRDSLVIFNALLIGVMAIILFSLTEATKHNQHRFNLYILFGLAVLSIITNCIALSAIVFRIQEYGMTPNRIAVLGADLLILTNLLLVAHKLFLFLKGKTGIDKVEKSIAQFLPIYCVWAALITFLLPLLFQYK